MAGYLCRDTLDADGVAYVRIAKYYATGQWDLAVSAYWSPFLSLLLAPLIAAGTPDLIAARIVMGMSALVYSYGCFAVLRVLGIPFIAVVLGTWLAALSSVFWSIRDISPDLLMSGLLCTGLGQWLAPTWGAQRRRAFLTGALCGGACVAKAAALPMTGLFAIGLALIFGLSSQNAWRRVLAQTGWTMAGLAVVAGPWLLILSWHCGRPTIGTAGVINHSLIGPPDGPRIHPTFHSYRPPPPGRLTTWEDPSGLPYRYWSVFESAAHLQHQLRVVGRNVVSFVAILSSFDALYLGLPATVVAFVLFLSGSAGRNGGRWSWSLAIIVCTAGVYLPLYCYELRYYYSVYPFLLGACFGLVSWFAGRKPHGGRVLLPLGWIVVSASFAFGHLLIVRSVSQKLDGPASATAVPERSWRTLLAVQERLQLHPAVTARELADRIRSAGVAGSIAGEGNAASHMEKGLRDWHESLYVAFFLEQPWHGQMHRPTVTDLQHSGARLVIIHRREPLLTQLDRHPLFRDLDKVLFASPAQAARFPLKVYELNTGGTE